jgi:uncharacterized repeat protein (TIGR03803 family)
MSDEMGAMSVHRLTLAAVTLSALAFFAPRFAQAGTVYVGNSLTVTSGNSDGLPPFIILGEYNPKGPLAASSASTTLPAGTVVDVKFYGSKYNFTLYALSHVSTGPKTNEQTFKVVASEQFSGSPSTGVQTLSVTNFNVNAGDLLAFAGTGPYYPQSANDTTNSDAAYENSTNTGSFTATAPGGPGSEFTVGLHGDMSANYGYVSDSYGNQGRTYTFGVDVSETSSSPGTNIAAPVLTTLHAFTGSDGADSQAGLTASGNTLFGTTSAGGASSDGTVFTVNTDGGGFSVLHSFTGTDGSSIQADLFLSGNTLYGAADFGGADNDGTLFALMTDGTDFTNIHIFSGTPDGAYPRGGLLLSGNILYGTTTGGGSALDEGMVFAVETNGANFTALHTFGGPDGDSPKSDLVLGGNVLYGATIRGGASNVGTIYSVRIDGSNFASLHTFW